MSHKYTHIVDKAIFGLLCQLHVSLYACTPVIVLLKYTVSYKCQWLRKTKLTTDQYNSSVIICYLYIPYYSQTAILLVVSLQGSWVQLEVQSSKFCLCNVQNKKMMLFCGCFPLPPVTIVQASWLPQHALLCRSNVTVYAGMHSLCHS